MPNLFFYKNTKKTRQIALTNQEIYNEDETLFKSIALRILRESFLIPFVCEVFQILENYRRIRKQKYQRNFFFKEQSSHSDDCTQLNLILLLPKTGFKQTMLEMVHKARPYYL